MVPEVKFQLFILCFEKVHTAEKLLKVSQIVRSRSEIRLIVCYGFGTQSMRELILRGLIFSSIIEL